MDQARADWLTKKIRNDDEKISVCSETNELKANELLEPDEDSKKIPIMNLDSIKLTFDTSSKPANTDVHCDFDFQSKVFDWEDEEVELSSNDTPSSKPDDEEFFIT